MGLTINGAEFQKLSEHATDGFPHEVVGILAGVRATNRVTRVLPLINERADTPQNRYQVSGLMLMRAEQALAAAGFEVVGYYHSHPDHPSQYSDFDRDHALPNMSYLILSVQGGVPATAQSWRLRDDRSAMDEEPIQIED